MDLPRPSVSVDPSIWKAAKSNKIRDQLKQARVVCESCKTLVECEDRPVAKPQRKSELNLGAVLPVVVVIVLSIELDCEERQLAMALTT